MSYKRRLSSGILAEMIKQFKGCTIQSTISDSAQYDSDKQVEAINDSDKKVDAINDSDKQVDAINDSDKQVNAINNSEELVDVGSDPASNTRSYPKVATYNTNETIHKIY